MHIKSIADIFAKKNHLPPFTVVEAKGPPEVPYHPGHGAVTPVCCTGRLNGDCPGLREPHATAFK